MGRCMNCEKEIHIEKGDKLICSCGENPYKCWNCKTILTDTPHECVICGFYVCKNCHKCGKNCNLDTYCLKTKEKFNFLALLTDKNVKDLIEYIYSLKKGIERQECPERNVSISYAKGKNKDLFYKINGFDCKSEEDSKKFNEKIDEIINFSIGTKWTISQIRENGSKGIEFREASNLLICSGLVKKNRVVEKDSKGKIKKEYQQFERVELPPCKHLLNPTELIKYICPRCESEFDKTMEGKECDCIYVKGDNKGKHPKIEKSKTKYSLCGLNRTNFI